MPDVDAISVTRDDHVARIAQHFAVREVSTAFVEPMVILERPMPLGDTLVRLEQIGMEVAGRARLCADPAAPTYYAVYAQGAV
jgi:hypothetical protein